MENPNWAVSLMESRRADLAREAELTRLESELPRRPAPWRALLVTAVLLIGMIAWLIH